MFTTSPNEIEASDIDAVQRTGDAIPLGDGRIALPVHLILSPHTGKSYTGKDFPAAIHLTNGVQARRLDIEDWRPALAVAPEMSLEPDTSDESDETELQGAPATGKPNVGIELEADGEEHEATLEATAEPESEAASETAVDASGASNGSAQQEA